MFIFRVEEPLLDRVWAEGNDVQIAVVRATSFKRLSFFECFGIKPIGHGGEGLVLVLCRSGALWEVREQGLDGRIAGAGILRAKQRAASGTCARNTFAHSKTINP